ncbi:type II toxin-antitoxin system HicA family toxin [candidate division KSB1 bacterium]|nr:type II toxin-antitoxin system HicA family toxin [candidate division KSB1 bacterium]
MRPPRDVSGMYLVKALEKYGYRVTRQTGSHLRLSTTVKGEHHITIPKHDNLKAGTLNNILKEISEHLKTEKQVLIQEIFK